MKIDLSGKTAVVTGATGQLGRTMARTLAQCGADVAVHYLQNEAGAQALVQEITAMGRKAVAVQANVTDRPSIEAMRDRITNALCAPHIVVNNAVAQIKWTTVLAQDDADFTSQYETCTLHNVFMAKTFLPAMIERGGGRFIGINTECAMMAAPTSSAYVAAKRGMDGIYRVLAKEVGPHGITVNQIAPGYTISDRDREQGTQEQPAYTAGVPLGRRGTDQEIANAVAFLASDLAGFITGVYLPVCGGQVMPAI